MMRSQILKVISVFACLATGYGCQVSQPTSTTNLLSDKNPKICIDAPQGKLDAKKVKEISLGTQSVKESGIVSADTSIGYSFNAKSDRELSYRTEDSICVWVYSPDNKLLTNGKITQSGKYTIQVSALKGQNTFNLIMRLDSKKIVEPRIYA
jgi:hypothetical protein